MALLVSWITKDDNIVQDFTSKIQQEQNINFQGYQKLSEIIGKKDGAALNKQQEIEKQVKAIYEYMKHNNFQYCDSSKSFASNAQDINLPRHSINSKSGNCIDLSILLATVIDRFAQPIIIIKIGPNGGHAIVGWRIWDNVNSYVPLETMGIIENEFNQNIERGWELAKNWGIEDELKNGFNKNNANYKDGVFTKGDIIILNIDEIISKRNIKPLLILD